LHTTVRQMAQSRAQEWDVLVPEPSITVDGITPFEHYYGSWQFNWLSAPCFDKLFCRECDSDDRLQRSRKAIEIFEITDGRPAATLDRPPDGAGVGEQLFSEPSESTLSHHLSVIMMNQAPGTLRCRKFDGANNTAQLHVRGCGTFSFLVGRTQYCQAPMNRAAIAS